MPDGRSGSTPLWALHTRYQRRRRHVKEFGNFHELQNVDLSFACLDLPYEGVGPLEAGCQLPLGQTGLLTGRDQDVDERPMAGAAELFQSGASKMDAG